MKLSQLLVSAAALTGATGWADAQSAPLYDPRQFPETRGVVQQFTLTPRGDIDGLILADGTEVKTPPHLSTQIAYAVRLGDSVTIHGLRAAALPLVKAVSIADDQTGRTIVDDGPPGPRPDRRPPPDAGPRGLELGLAEIRGRVRTTLHGPEGDVNGALLDDGTILRLPPREAARFTELLQPGKTLAARGRENKTAVGKVVDTREIGPASDQMSPVGGPPDRGRGPDAPPPPPRS